MKTAAGTREVYRPTLGFDIAPGASGPARYVAALVRGLAAESWDVRFPLAEGGAPGEQAGAQSASVASSSASQRRSAGGLKRCVPAPLRYVAGFAQQSWRISRRLAVRPVDLFHAQNTGCEETPVGCRWSGAVRVLGTLHVDATYDPHGTRDRYLQRSLEWLSNRCLHQAIAVSEATKRDWLRRTRLREDQIAVIHNGIDPARVGRRQSRGDARAALKLPRDAVILGAMGRLDGVKGFEYLIEALALLAPDCPRLVLAIAGTGPLAESLAGQAAARGLRQRVVLLGYCQDVDQFLDACDVFVLSSLSEALPFALLEAMSHELPVVGTRVGGVPEVIVQGETGLLVPPRDASGLAAAIAPLVDRPDLRQKLGSAGRERIVAHFHEADMVRRTVDMYQHLLSQ